MSVKVENVKPQGFVLLRYNDPKVGEYHKLFVSWRDDEWRLSSGCDLSKLKDLGQYWELEQFSGSVYTFPKGEEDGYTFYTGRVLENIIGQNGLEGVGIRRVKLADELNRHSITPIKG